MSWTDGARTGVYLGWKMALGRSFGLRNLKDVEVIQDDIPLEAARRLPQTCLKG